MHLNKTVQRSMLHTCSFALFNFFITVSFCASLKGYLALGLPCCIRFLTNTIKQSLESQGFNVTIWSADLAVTSRKFMPGTAKGSIENFKQKYDAVFLFADIAQFATINSMRLQWPSPMASIAPWYSPELPTIFVSLNLTNHLIDVPRVPIYINAYNNRKETIDLVIKKIVGESEFKGTYEETVWCNLWDTHL